MTETALTQLEGQSRAVKFTALPASVEAALRQIEQGNDLVLKKPPPLGDDVFAKKRGGEESELLLPAKER